MDAKDFLKLLNKSGIDFFTGVPDSLLGKFCDCLMNKYGIDSGNHIVGHNEGGCVGLASGYHLATGKVPCVYMQNSGIGNALNPIVSLTHPKVYGIPVLYIIGWRGEPGIKDEPQHIFQGEVTDVLLKDIGIEKFVIDTETDLSEVETALRNFLKLFKEMKSAAFIIRKNTFTGSGYPYRNEYELKRERAIEIITGVAKKDIVVSTTGKISRELFETRDSKKQTHDRDFYTVGSMGHCSMIALGIALNDPRRRVWCVDGDGAILMHLGSLGVIACRQPVNYIHIVLNNQAHETVGGMPTVVKNMDLGKIATACGYKISYAAKTETELIEVLNSAVRELGPLFIEVKVALGARANLGRPTTTPLENKEKLMSYLMASDL